MANWHYIIFVIKGRVLSDGPDSHSDGLTRYTGRRGNGESIGWFYHLFSVVEIWAPNLTVCRHSPQFSAIGHTH